MMMMPGDIVMMLNEMGGMELFQSSPLGPHPARWVYEAIVCRTGSLVAERGPNASAHLLSPAGFPLNIDHRSMSTAEPFTVFSTWPRRPEIAALNFSPHGAKPRSP